MKYELKEGSAPHNHVCITLCGDDTPLFSTTLPSADVKKLKMNNIEVIAEKFFHALELQVEQDDTNIRKSKLSKSKKIHLMGDMQNLIAQRKKPEDEDNE